MQLAETNAIIGEKIAQLRGKAELSQAELASALAEKMGKERIDPTTITRLERGQRPITVMELIALAQVFDVPEESLLPESNAVEKAFSYWMRQIEELAQYLDLLKAREETSKEELAQATILASSLAALQNYQQDGNETEVADALSTLGDFADEQDAEAPKGARIDFLALLRDIGIHGDLIEQALAASTSGDDGVSFAKVGRYVSLHQPFPYNIPQPEDGDDEWTS
ncbi:helix-turn-helix domain-containing protein [Rhodococcus hoagii]|nr:helix-turn-helix domain-containing protein [Prescottella equi]